MCAANVSNSRLGKAEVFYFALADQILNRAGDVFHWHGGIDAMLVEKIDAVGFEALQRCFRDGFDVFRFAVDALAGNSSLKPKLRRDDNLVTNWSERLADDFFVCKRAVCFRRIEERHSASVSGADYLDRLILFKSWAKAEI